MSNGSEQLGQALLWDQLPGEPPMAYAHFRLYRDMGLERSLDAAYAIDQQIRGIVGGRTRAAGSWTRESARWRWEERAYAWDGYMARIGVHHTVLRFSQALHLFASKLVEALKRSEGPANWDQIKESLDLLGLFISPEALEVVCSPPPGGWYQKPEEKPGGGLRVAGTG